MTQLIFEILKYHESILLTLVAIVVTMIAPIITRGDGANSSRTNRGAVTTVQEAKKADVRELKPDSPIERELVGGEAHFYRVTLTAGQYLQVVVEQKGIDVVVNGFSPDRRQIISVDGSSGSHTAEAVSMVAEVEGSYRLDVEVRDKQAPIGRYVIRIAQQREATASDRTRVAGERMVWEGNRFRDQGTADSLRLAIEKYKEATTLWRGLAERDAEANAINETGFVYALLGESQKALEYYRQALLLWRAVENHREVAGALQNIGMAHVRLSKPREALEHFDGALLLWRSVGDRHGEATTLNSIGTAYDMLGERQKELEYFSQALEIRRALRDRPGEARTLNNIGVVYSSLGDKQKALEYYEQVLPLRRMLGDRRGEGTSLHNIGRVYQDLSDLKKALNYYDQSLRLRRVVGDRQGEALTLNSIGATYKDLGEFPKALEYYDQALLLNRSLKDSYNEAYNLSNIGVVYLKLGDSQKALDYHNKALVLRRTVGDRYGEAYTLANIGDAYFSLSAPADALSHLEQALSLARAVGDRNNEATTLQAMAHIERDLGHLDKARAQIERSLDIVESLRGKVVSQELRASYLASKQDRYEFYIDLLMRLHQQQPSNRNDVAAFEASERARARSLLEFLTEARVDIRQGVDPRLLERERSLQQQLNAKSERLSRLLGGKHTEEQEMSAMKEVETLLSYYQDVQAQVRANSPRYAALTQPQPLSLKAIQQQVLDEDTLLLAYALGDERSYLWAVTPTSITGFELPKRIEIETATRRVYDILVNKADALYPEALTSLSQTLLGPVADQLGRKRLLIVAAGALQYLPFGALPVPSAPGTGNRGQKSGIGKPIKAQPLAVSHEIANSPSASVVAVLRQELSERTTAPNKVIVLADPVFRKDDERVKHAIKIQEIGGPNEGQKRTAHSSLPSDIERSASDLNLTSFDRLRVSRSEAEVIAAMAPKGQSLKALDFAASRETATSPSLARYQIVHFATHSLLNNHHPELSGIVLSLVDEQGQPQDGFLRLHEIYNLNLAANLVVLSACQTALGKEIKGEGLVGLTRGFMYAGTPRVVATLWKVSDRATAELMKRFYQKMLKEGLRPAAALRAAQVSMLREKQWAAPYYWAGFVLQGEWR